MCSAQFGDYAPLDFDQAFEWVVRDVSKLKDFVEGPEIVEDGQESSQDDFEILKESPMMGDGRFKLEIGTACMPFSLML